MKDVGPHKGQRHCSYKEVINFKNHMINVLQGMGFTVQELHPLIHTHVQVRGVWLRATHVTLKNTLLLEPEWPIDVIIIGKS